MVVTEIGKPKTPWWFWLVSGIALLWNLMGVGAYISDMNMSHADMVKNYGQALADAAQSQPAFVTGAYAFAVFGGALGCLLLLLRKKNAIWPLLISLLAVFVQQGYSWFGTDVMSSVPAANKVMYIAIVVVAILLVWFARKMTAKRILR
ncbi:hypothetical protein [Hellea balneolensis]|uniref:hypothetical protein n=1 Tax=Hellea balneolensis TaxID=287478 RepID=UPI000405651A|nr:hypothetical protein [Hellea balneolensis]